MPPERIILHVDANYFYANVSLCWHPWLRGKPLAIGGDVEARHGIVLTATPEAKRQGVKTGMALWQARQVCPQLLFLPPDYDRYLEYSQRLRDMYQEYTPLVEPYGLDECWVDLTDRNMTMVRGIRIANTLRSRIYEELGITVSVGVSFNKVFAKLGSDMKKPDATTVITRENYKEKVWPLPVSDLLFVGDRTAAKMISYNIVTIGDLARRDPVFLSYKFGKVGLMLQAYARGEDISPVASWSAENAIKTIGNSSTLPHDVTDWEGTKAAVYMLAESVAMRLRKANLLSRCVHLAVRGSDLSVAGCQVTIPTPTCLCDDIAKTALDLFQRRYINSYPFRSIGVRCSSLLDQSHGIQLDMLGNTARTDQQLSLARSIDDIRRRFGPLIIQRGVILQDRGIAGISPSTDAPGQAGPVPFNFG